MLESRTRNEHGVLPGLDYELPGTGTHSYCHVIQDEKIEKNNMLVVLKNISK
jgi:hypothetical protein